MCCFRENIYISVEKYVRTGTLFTGVGDKLNPDYFGDQCSMLDRQNDLSDWFNLRDTSQQNEQHLRPFSLRW